jgi:hypothetical protein
LTTLASPDFTPVAFIYPSVIILSIKSPRVGTEYWFGNNWGAICFLNEPLTRPLVIPVFEPNGTRRDLEGLYKDVLRVIGDRA